MERISSIANRKMMFYIAGKLRKGNDPN